ncbi:unnamed protein product [Mytilus coruscus]|uniref:HSPA12A n=1 Tax=Mytilus coruscus TaxID=42192 RepID=A0A6J8BKE2_MYTCO|nr:unnamed protein product [Mytilus coruscus]
MKYNEGETSGRKDTLKEIETEIRSLKDKVRNKMFTFQDCFAMSQIASFFSRQGTRKEHIIGQDMHDEDLEISMGMMILDVTGKELPAIKVFTESIRFLKDHFLVSTFTKISLGYSIDDIFFVITVPAIWSDAAKQFMRVASERAGINSSQMMLAYEPEAAALFCSLLPEDQGIAKYFQEGRRLMIIDLGGKY